MAQHDEQRVPLIEEHASIQKRIVETGTVAIHTSTQETVDALSEPLSRHEVAIERVPIGVNIESMPEIRYEDDVIIIPVVEERLIVHKQLVLTEELRVYRKQITELATIPVTLRSTAVSVERDARAESEGSGHGNHQTTTGER